MKLNWMKATGAAVLMAAALVLTGAPQEASAAPSAEVKEIFSKNCKKCHGWDGKGQTPQGKKVGARDWTSASYQKGAKDDAILKTILDGYKDPKDPKRKMDGYKGKVTDAQAKELVKVVREYAKGCPFPGEK